MHTCCKSLYFDREQPEQVPLGNSQKMRSEVCNTLKVKNSSLLEPMMVDKTKAIRRIECTGVVLWEPSGPRPTQSCANSAEDADDNTRGDSESNSEVGVAMVLEVDSESEAQYNSGDGSELSSADDPGESLNDLPEEV
ncbi:hypothetical protein ST47_g4449 [Ascochyta rabiei]|uniref:Uncharacterized protein n=1 Tax=Didymella rabiei TaxID=5454 RepID=A0A163FKZ3_DIDRA|nr:hypothetical protein ST47_g4449 [Ascochyta rabiei]